MKQDDDLPDVDNPSEISGWGSMAYEYNDENRTLTLTERNGSKVTYVHDAHYCDVKTAI